jgi:hypothetical protein
LGNTEIEEKGLLLRVADRMEAFTSVVAGMVDEVEKRVKECVQVSKDTGEKIEGAVERMAAERVSEDRRDKWRHKRRERRQRQLQQLKVCGRRKEDCLYLGQWYKRRRERMGWYAWK